MFHSYFMFARSLEAEELTRVVQAHIQNQSRG